MFDCYLLYSFSIAAITNHCKPSGSRQHKLIISQFCRSEVPAGFAGFPASCFTRPKSMCWLTGCFLGDSRKSQFSSILKLLAEFSSLGLQDCSSHFLTGYLCSQRLPTFFLTLSGCLPRLPPARQVLLMPQISTTVFLLHLSVSSAFLFCHISLLILVREISLFVRAHVIRSDPLE